MPGQAVHIKFQLWHNTNTLTQVWPESTTTPQPPTPTPWGPLPPTLTSEPTNILKHATNQSHQQVNKNGCSPLVCIFRFCRRFCNFCCHSVLFFTILARILISYFMQAVGVFKLFHNEASFFRRLSSEIWQNVELAAHFWAFLRSLVTIKRHLKRNQGKEENQIKSIILKS